ncbi:MAG: hypothetical protein GY768_30540 [Planctomycetaceae bacterium]|nr:hypothetical protein [Planctomycetaceae bacterium]
MSNFIHLFPLSVYHASVDLSPEYKSQLIQLILEMETAEGKGQTNSAWLGDTSGFEFLFQREEFRELYRRIAETVKDYTHKLGMNNDLIDFYFQRSWATVTRRGEKINEHSHDQSNISFAYYLQKPTGSGGINFITYNHPNELSRGIFTPAKANMGFIDRPSMLTWNIVSIEPKEDEIYIFPSKTLHSTTPSESDQSRISISADITLMLRDSQGHETMMPHFRNWRSFDE